MEPTWDVNDEELLPRPKLTTQQATNALICGGTISHRDTEGPLFLVGTNQNIFGNSLGTQSIANATMFQCNRGCGECGLLTIFLLNGLYIKPSQI